MPDFKANDYDVHHNLSLKWLKQFEELIASEPNDYKLIDTTRVVQFIDMKIQLEALLKTTTDLKLVAMFHYQLGLLLSRCINTFKIITSNHNSNARSRIIIDHLFNAYIKFTAANGSVKLNESLNKSIQKLLAHELLNWDYVEPCPITTKSDLPADIHQALIDKNRLMGILVRPKVKESCCQRITNFVSGFFSKKFAFNNLKETFSPRPRHSI